ncbi:MAG: crossover junction endodeoxyribonuclease RuvC [Candidatus Paceibacterota bacterium]|jgi:crossover junction endodeoxyribonuclease RuvC
MRIIAIDPGYERMGVAVLEKTAGKETLVFSECFKTSAKITHDKRLRLIGQEAEKVIKKYKPEAMAIETLFFGNNQKTAMHVSEARGVMLYVAAVAGLVVKEFSPVDIKIAVTGYGKSDKMQVTSMVEKLIKIGRKIEYDDEYDAIAVGLTYFATQRGL